MRQILILLTMALMATACSKEDSDYVGANLTQNHSSQEGYHAVYEADWVKDNQVVDHTTLEFNGSVKINHYPNYHILPHFDYSSTGSAEGYPINDIVEEQQSSWIDLVQQGTSTYSNYYSGGSNEIRYQLNINQTSYVVMLTCADGWPTAVYDQNNDQWIITLRIREVDIYNASSSEPTPQRWQWKPELVLTLVTTRRIQ